MIYDSQVLTRDCSSGDGCQLEGQIRQLVMPDLEEAGKMADCTVDPTKTVSEMNQTLQKGLKATFNVNIML